MEQHQTKGSVTTARLAPPDARPLDAGLGPFQRLRIRLHALARLTRLIVLVVRWGASPLLRRLLRLRPDPIPIGVRLREVLQSLGMTFSKFGQYLATRFDLLPESVYREMQLFFESSPPFPFAQVRVQIERELGGPLEQFFEAFDEEAIAAASIGQVHRAVARDGQRVAVKVQRPRIEQRLMADLQVLRWFAKVTDALGVWGRMSAGDTVQAFAASTVCEMDFTQEAQAAEAIRRHARRGVTAPRVRSDLTGRRVLTTEWIEGVSLLKVIECVGAKDWDRLRRILPGIDYRTMVERYVDECLWQLFGSGLFHGDPHPGNVLIGRSGTIHLVDFGIVGILSLEERKAFTGFFESLAVGDLEMCYHYYRILSPPSTTTDITRYRRGLTEIIHDWHLAAAHPRIPAADRHAGRFMGRVAGLMRENAVRWEPNHQLFWRCILTLHAVQLRLAPDLDLFDAFRRTFDRVRPQPQRQLQAVLQDPATWAHAARAREAAGRVIAGAAPDTADGWGLAILREGTRGPLRARWPDHAGIVLLFLPACILAAAGSGSALLLALVPLALWPALRRRVS